MFSMSNEMPRGVITENDIQTLERREAVIRLRARQYSIPQIARELGTSASLVQQDLKSIRADWLRKVARNKAAWMAEVLADVEEVRQIALIGYFESDKPAEERTVEIKGRGTKTERENRRKRKKTLKKDPRFLAIVQEADKQRAAILGLGDKAAIENVDAALGKRRPKMLVVRDREQARQLVDVTKLLELEFTQPETPQEDVIDGSVLVADSGQAVPEPVADDKPQDAL